jgi:hypothetical protein
MMIWLVKNEHKKNTNGLFSFGFIILFALSPLSGLAQRAKIDSLKNVLPTLQGKTRVDCLNILSLAYSYLDSDTAQVYQQKAFTEAKQIQYQVGEAMSLNNKARIAGHHRDFSGQEKISLEVIESYSRLPDKKVVVEAYMNLALAFFCQGLFEKSEEACAKVMEIAEHSANKRAYAEAIAIMGSIGFETGNYEKSFEYFNRSLQLFTSIDDKYNTAILLAKIGDLYRLAGDHKIALDFYQQSLGYKKVTSLVWHPLADLGDAYYSLEPYDSSMNEHGIYLQTIKSLTIRSNSKSFSNILKAEKHLANREYDHAISLLQEDFSNSKKNDKNYEMRWLLDMARAHNGKRDFKTAFRYAQQLLQTANQSHAKQYLRDGYRIMYMLNDQLHRTDSAYHYFVKYTAMKDSVSLDNFSKRLAIHATMAQNEKTQAQLELISKEKEINEERLKNEVLLKNILISGIFLLGLLAAITFRNSRLKQKNESHKRALVEKELDLQKLESEKTRKELQQRALELEMQALRAQMNPHFIFNSLNSINRFILQSNKAQASEYLTKFSRLIRLILQNSQLALITLESELESLQLYMELEAVRFEHHFEFDVKVQPTVDVSAIKVPPLIIQPYAENAIWHGLMHKTEKGHLRINIFEDGNMLNCKITDDGIGRKKAAELKSKSASAHKSMGMKISADRIALMHKKKELEMHVTIIDLMLADGSPGGTEVLLKIPMQYD